MPNFNFLARALITTGIILILVGLLFGLAPRLLWLGRLPGDIYITRKNFTFYFPVATGIILSVIISLILLFFSRK